MGKDLSERELKVLDAVIQHYVETAEPAGSRTLAKNYPFGVSAATIRNTMSDLEEKGYLFHTHTSAGRIPTDLAYRMYVDRLMWPKSVAEQDQVTLREAISRGGNAIDDILEKAAEILGLLTKELGMAVSPSFDEAELEQLELVKVSSERLLMVLVLKGGAASTIYIEVGNTLPAGAIKQVARVLNERLSGLELSEIRRSVRERLRDASTDATDGTELLNIFVQQADILFHSSAGDSSVVLGSAQLLAGQPEFSSNEQMKTLLELTERREVLQSALKDRQGGGLTVTIGGENVDPKLSGFTLVTSTYQSGPYSGVLGIMGPTRMPYDKVVALVEYTSRLMGDLSPKSGD